MSDKLITLGQITGWLDDLDSSLKDRVMMTGLSESKTREEMYALYQAAQLLRARMLEDFSEEVEFNHHMYDETK